MISDELAIGYHAVAPACVVCRAPLEEKTKHGYRYNPPFTPPKNHCPEHGYPWEQYALLPET